MLEKDQMLLLFKEDLKDIRRFMEDQQYDRCNKLTEILVRQAYISGGVEAINEVQKVMQKRQ